MGCTLGRASLPSPDFIRQEGGGRLRVGHSGYAFDGTDGLVMAQQVTGYPNPDEEVISFTYDATLAGGVLDGFYFVDSTNVDWAKLAAGLFAWEAVLVPVKDSTAGGFEITTVGGLRPNDQTVVAASAVNFVGFPVAAVADRTRSAIGAPATVYGANANASVHTATVDAASLLDHTIELLLAPADAYKVAATIKQGTSRVASATAPVVTTWAAVTGRTIQQDPTMVMVDNDIIRVLYGPSTGQLLVGQWQDSAVSGNDAWTYKAYKLTTDGSTATSLGDPVAVTVNVNSPAVCSVRFWYDLGSGAARYADVTLRRGQTWAEVRISEAYSGATAAHGVFRYSVEAGTAAGAPGGGIDANVDDGDNNKYRIRVDEADTIDTTNGGLYLSSATQTAVFGIGTDFFSSSPQVESGFYGISESDQQVVAR